MKNVVLNDLLCENLVQLVQDLTQKVFFADATPKRGNKLFFLGASFALVVSSGAWYLPGDHAPTWNRSAITATFIGAQIREIGPGNTTLFVAYALQNLPMLTTLWRVGRASF